MNLASSELKGQSLILASSWVELKAKIKDFSIIVGSVKEKISDFIASSLWVELKEQSVVVASYWY